MEPIKSDHLKTMPEFQHTAKHSAHILDPALRAESIRKSLSLQDIYTTSIEVTKALKEEEA